MRQIKFRAWSVNDKAIIDWNTIKQSSFNYGELHLAHSILTSNDEIYNVMQFTNLLDKNGKEIFEGDIVSGIFHMRTGERVTTYKRQKNTYAIYSDLLVKGVVVFKYGCWWFESDFKVDYQTGFYTGMGRTNAEKKANESVATYSKADDILSKILFTIEVIGNIYENPELLKS